MPLKHLPARLESLPELMDFISDQAVQKGFSAEAVYHVCLAAEEALVNVINHAYPKASPGDLAVQVASSDAFPLILEIRDQGAAFNPLSLPDPDLDADVSRRKVGGMGVFLIRRMTDEVRYRRERDTNFLTLAFSGTRRPETFGTPA